LTEVKSGKPTVGPWAFRLRLVNLRAIISQMGNSSRSRSEQPTEYIEPWNAWYHVTNHVCGSWVRGDPRGWRSRHHREHVDGDYKNPPPTGEVRQPLRALESPH